MAGHLPPTDCTRKPVILVFSNFYLPGFRGGGPIRSLSALTDRLGDEFDFWVVTADRDAGSKEPYAGVLTDGWTPVGKAQVRYLSKSDRTFLRLRDLMNGTRHDVVYLNSFFTPDFTIKPLVLRAVGLVSRVPVVVAPRGEFNPGALRLKRSKKRAFLALVRLIRIYEDCIWHATSSAEAARIRGMFKRPVTVVAAELVTAEQHASPLAPTDRRPKKEPGDVRIVCICRVARMKNITFAIKILSQATGRVVFDIFGPMEDPAYWKECEEVAAHLPQNIEVRYKGELEPTRVISALHGYHFFLLPTLGENFGHAIREALSSGCPVLLSDQTPWRHLNQFGIGWDLPLADEAAFRRALQSCVDMDADRYSKMSRAAREHVLDGAAKSDALNQNRAMFRAALAMAESSNQS